MNAGVALRLDPNTVVIDVDQYGDKAGAVQLAELEAQYGPLPVTITSTSRGQESPSRQHFYLLPEPTPLKSKAAPDVDVLQNTHRFAVAWPSIHPDTLQQYTFYGYDGEPLEGIPSIGDLEALPDAWVEALRATEPEAHTGFAGAVDEWLETLVDGEPSARVHAFIDSIPAADFGHDEMRSLSFRLVRLGAEREPGIDRAMTVLYREWLRGKYDTPDYRHDLDVTLQGAIKKAGAIESEVPDLLPSVEVFNEAPAEIFSMARERPTLEDDGAYAAARREIIKACFEHDFTDKQRILTVLWNSAVGRVMQHEPDGLTTLWREIEFVATQPTQHLATVTQIETKRAEAAELFLTRAEKEYLTEQGQWWGTEYVKWAKSRLRRTNDPYNRANRWTVLSLVFCTTAHLLKDGIPMDLNLFQMILGESSTGKTKSKDLMREAIKAYFPHDASPNIGGDMSKEALTRVLIQRDGQVSWLHRDDVSGLLKEMQGGKGSWQDGIIEKWCELYEGRVDPMHRQSDRENSGIEAKCYLVTHLVGVESQVADVADTTMWASGLFPRFVFMIGEPKDANLRGQLLNLVQDEAVLEGDPIAKQWAAEFTAAVRALSIQGRAIGITDEANRRYAQFHEATLRLIEKSNDTRVGPMQERFINSVLKAAALVALSEGELVITLRHLLIALEQAEEWWRNALRVISITAEGPLDREVQRLEDMIRSTVGRQMRQADIYAAFRPARHAEEVIQQLLKEERIVTEDIAGSKMVRLVEDVKVAA